MNEFLNLINLTDERLFLLWIAIASIGAGLAGALEQANIKRFFAFTTLMSVGYALVSINNFWLTFDSWDLKTALIYFLFYSVGFVVFLGLFVRSTTVYLHQILSGIYSEENNFTDYTKQGYTLFILLGLNLAGLPPSPTFFAKYYIIKSSLDISGFEQTIVAAVLMISTILIAYIYCWVLFWPKQNQIKNKFFFSNSRMSSAKIF